MNTRPAPFLSAFLTLAMVLSVAVAGLGHGYARAMAPAAEIEELVICGENGVEIIHVDARGRPVAPDDCLQGLCSDCLTVVSGLSDAPPPTLRETIPSRLAALPAAPLCAARVKHRANLPRAPPLRDTQV